MLLCGLHQTQDMMTHGRAILPHLEVLGYSLTLKDRSGFIGDRASNRAFFSILDELREPLCEAGTDPFDNRATEDLTLNDIDAAWDAGDVFAAGVVFSAVEEFAQRLARVVRAYRLADEHWAKVGRIAVGGGLRDSRIGEIAIGRTTAILRFEGITVDLVPITQDPDEAALLGGLRLIEEEKLHGFSQMLAVDIGGSSIRAGLIEFSPKAPHDLSEAAVIALDQWKYAEEDEEPSRDAAVERLAQMLGELKAKAGKKLAPYLTLACPGCILDDGGIRDGAQNLPGDWEADDFRLPEALAAHLGVEFEIVMHNDAVVQGLSEADQMQENNCWAVITIGTGLGNAVYRNRDA